MSSGTEPARIAIVGTGRRGLFFLRVALLMPARFEVVAVVARTPERRAEIEREFGVATVASHDELDALALDFVFAAVTWESAPVVAASLAEAGIRVLLETPPAPDRDGLRELWARVGHLDLVQVAEHSMYIPGQQARLAAVDAGIIGTPTSVQVSSNHGYHAVAIMRGFLRPGFTPVTVRATEFEAPLASPLVHDEWQSDLEPTPTVTTIATLDFGSGMGLYDFTNMQWFNALRYRRLLIRGSLGEIHDDLLVRLGDDAIIESHIVRRHLEGFDLNHISIDGVIRYRNPFRGLRVSDEDIAALELLTRMSDWARGEGAAPYPLAEACEDHHIALAIEQSARTGQPITTTVEAWGAGRATPRDGSAGAAG
jgi:predicted dehydrogenase